MRLPHLREADGLDVALLGIPFDGAVSYRPGARFAPREIRQQSSLIRPYNPTLQVSPFDVLRVADVGDVDVNPISIEDTFSRVELAVSKIIAAGAIPICVGGDHSLTLPILRAVAQRYGAVGVVHVDSHQDVWDEYFGGKYFHGTPFRRAVEDRLVDPARMIQIGIRGSLYSAEDFDFGQQRGIHVITADEVTRRGVDWVKEHIATLRGSPVYLSFDIDGVDPAFAPGTGTPEVAGLTSRDALGLVRALDGLELVGADLVEVSPPYDPAGITSLLAANLLFEMVSVIATTRLGRDQGSPPKSRNISRNI
jgi:agmatinase